MNPDDLVHHADGWDLALQKAFKRSTRVKQPLAELLSPAQNRQWKTVASNPKKLPSLRTLFAGLP